MIYLLCLCIVIMVYLRVINYQQSRIIQDQTESLKIQERIIKTQNDQIVFLTDENFKLYKKKNGFDLLIKVIESKRTM
jgi:hypothetical protein